MKKIPQLSNFEKAAVFLSLCVRKKLPVAGSADIYYLPKILSHRFQIQEVSQIISGSRLGICSGHIESAEWMLQNNGSS